ncbi:MAG: chorismate mutase [Lachnospiraceae bacterium]|nr:chorismate mutase [Lachnospiraceae bacterium]MBR5179806.1 chorismate mutase [Lachnospiraceae bacterium]
MKDLKELRTEIDIVDKELVELLKKRYDITEQIGEYKAKTGAALFCPEREEEKIVALSEKLGDYKNAEYIENTFRAVMDYAKYQQSNNTYGRKDIFLIGMPGCGKTTVGKILAAKIQRELIDMDKLFTYVYQITPADCIEKNGEEEFRHLETALLLNIKQRKDFYRSLENSPKKNSTCSRIISCGGGIVVKDENRETLKRDAIVIYIKRDISQLAKNGRPLSQKTGIETLYEQRAEKYETWSDFTVVNDKDLDSCAEEIVKILKNQEI